LLGVGCDLEPGTLIAAYRRGIFPMIVETPEPLLGWWSPNPRGILPLERFRATRSLRQSAKRFEVRIDTDFEQVIRACADPKRPKGWITDDFVQATRGSTPWAGRTASKCSIVPDTSPAVCMA